MDQLSDLFDFLFGSVVRQLRPLTFWFPARDSKCQWTKNERMARRPAGTSLAFKLGQTSNITLLVVLDRAHHKNFTP